MTSDGTQIAYTIELPWRDNKPNISCIPTGDYICKYTWSPAFRRMMYILMNVPGRSGIRIHKGSFAGATDHGLRSDFLGCISFGKGYTKIGEQWILHTTAATIANIEDVLNKEDFILRITGDFAPIS